MNKEVPIEGNGDSLVDVSLIYGPPCPHIWIIPESIKGRGVLIDCSVCENAPHYFRTSLSPDEFKDINSISSHRDNLELDTGGQDLTRYQEVAQETTV